MLGKWVEKKVAEVIQPLVGEVVKLKNEVSLKASKDEVEELAREITELNVALDKIEKETVNKAYQELIRRLDTEYKLYKDAIKRGRTEVEALVEDCKECVNVQEFEEFRAGVDMEFKRLDETLEQVAKRLGEFDKRLDELEERLKKLEAKKTKKSRRSKKS